MSARRRLATLAVAVGGVLIGHWLTYLAVAPIAGSRATILHQTGHSYLGLANDLALVAALAAMASMFIAQLTTPEPAGGAPGGHRPGRAVPGVRVHRDGGARTRDGGIAALRADPHGHPARSASPRRSRSASWRRSRSAGCSAPPTASPPPWGAPPLPRAGTCRVRCSPSRSSSPSSRTCPRSASAVHLPPSDRPRRASCASHQTTGRRMDHACPRETPGRRRAGDRRARADPRHRVRACRTERRAVRSRGSGSSANRTPTSASRTPCSSSSRTDGEPVTDLGDALTVTVGFGDQTDPIRSSRRSRSRDRSRVEYQAPFVPSQAGDVHVHASRHARGRRSSTCRSRRGRRRSMTVQGSRPARRSPPVEAPTNADLASRIQRESDRTTEARHRRDDGARRRRRAHRTPPTARRRSASSASSSARSA